MSRMGVCTVGRQRSGLGAYCGSHISETLEPEQQWNPGTWTKLCQAAGESCQCKRPNLYHPSLTLTLTLASLWVIVSALQTLSILSCPKLDTESKGGMSPSLAAVNKNEHSLVCEFPLPRLCSPKLLCCTGINWFCFIHPFAGISHFLMIRIKLKEGKLIRTRHKQWSRDILIDISSSSTSSSAL